MHSDITFIASDLLAAEKVQNILRESPANCQVVLSNTQDLEEVSRSQVAQGAKVLIAFGMFAKIVRQSVDVPVIMVDLQAEDVMDALLEASKLGKRIAIFGFRRVLKDVFYVRDLLSIDLVWLPTVSPEKIPHELEKVQDIDVLVGGYYQARIAKQYGIPTVLIKTRDSEIRKAISLAQSYLEKRQDESETGTPMMESSIYAAITVDCLGEILMMNRLASEYLKLDQLNAVAFSVDDVCPQFSRIADVISTRRPYLNQIAKLEDRIFLYHAEPILRKRDGTLEGVSVIFQDVNTVMSSEVSIRRTLTTKENQAVYSFDHILGNSPCMTQALRLALRYSKVDETVLIQGETGVGKEMFAQGIHRASRRRDMPFVAVNCASLPESILESELFGYVKGAFTGASRDGKRGLFECAHTGTIFLDEIGEISPSMQGKLLRVLQEHSIRRIGAETPIPIDIRIIAATNRDLVSMVREGTFRADLYFRINVLGLCIPPLRQRQGDIILLADAFLSETSERAGRYLRFSSQAKAAMLRYDWPGNIRELQNMVRRVSVISDSDEIGPELVETYIQENRGLSAAGGSLRSRYTLEEALALSGGNKLRAAELLGTTAGGLTPGGVVALFPVPLFFNFMVATFLFGFAQENGTLKKVAEHLLYSCRGAGWLLGLLFFGVSAIVAGLGAGGAAPFFMSAICFSLALQAGIDPLLVSVALWTSSMVGGSMPWTSGYATNVGQLEIYFDLSTSSGYVVDFFTFRGIFYTILYVAMFVLLRGWRVRSSAVSLTRPAPFDTGQRQTLFIILGIIAMIVVPAAVQLLFPNPVTQWISTYCSFQFLAVIGITLNVLLKTADYHRVVQTRIPWDTLLMLSLTGMYMALANSMGVVSYLSDLLQNTIPAHWILPGVVLVMCVLSFFVSGGVVVPMMLPLLSALSSASGMPVGTIYCGMQMGLTASSISPFSQGGAAVLTGCSDESLRRRLIRQQTILAPIFSAVLVFVAILGGFRLVG